MDTDCKLYYSIGEVKEITGIEAHVLRYWESEFPTFRPRKGRSGQRTYTKKDIDMIFNIKKLLYEEKFTIKGAKTKLKETPVPEATLENDFFQKAISPSQAKKTAAGNTLSSETQKNKAALKNSPDTSQLVFGTIEKHAEINLADKDFLLGIKNKLQKISHSLKKMV